MKASRKEIVWLRLFWAYAKSIELRLLYLKFNKRDPLQLCNFLWNVRNINKKKTDFKSNDKRHNIHNTPNAEISARGLKLAKLRFLSLCVVYEP